MLLFVLFAIDVFGAVLGIYAMKSRVVSGKFKAISAGVMVGVALFWIFPDLMQRSGLVHAALVITVGVATLCGIDRYVYPVCPCCTRHQHMRISTDSCHSHPSDVGGTLIPLVMAICVHNLFDGWTAAVAGHAGAGPGTGLALGLVAHKIPEAVVFGLMLRGAANRSAVALLNACLTGFAILVGGVVHWSVPTLSKNTVVAISLALACSSFLFFGGHIFVRQLKRDGMRSALAPLLVGVLACVVVEQAISTALAR